MMAPIQILFIKAVSAFLFLFTLLPIIQCQGRDPLIYIDSLREVLSQLEVGSEKQNEILLELELRMYNSIKDRSLSQEERTRLMNVSLDLSFKRGEFSFLNPNFKPDTLNIEIIRLETDLQKLQDSIQGIQSRLIFLIEDENQTRSTKERATQLLATIHKEEVLKYLFENEHNLRFGVISSEMDDQEVEYSSRTAFSSIANEYYEADSYLLFPFLFQNLNKLDYAEISLIYTLLTHPIKFKSPWLLLEFMCENASPESKPVIKEFMLSFHQFKKPGKD